MHIIVGACALVWKCPAVQWPGLCVRQVARSISFEIFERLRPHYSSSSGCANVSVRCIASSRPIPILALLAGLAACTSEPTAQRAAPSLSASGQRNGAAGRHLVSGGARYSDTGAHPATGRSGSAAIAAQAVFGHGGTTEFTVTPYRAADTEFLAPVGCLDKVQVKAFGRDGKLVWTRNFNNLGLPSGASFTTRFTGLVPGMTLQVQANVRCLDGRRTDVVTATPSVIRRTDPAVVALEVPSQAPVNTPTLLVAKIQELNGDQGATGTCYLSVDGTLADSIPRVWVDAGGSVDCSFAPTFSAAGTRLVRVDFGNVVPRDDDPTNNSRSATLSVVVPPAVPPGTPPPPPPGFLAPFMITASVYDDTVNTSDVLLFSERLASKPAVLIDTLYSANSQHGNAQFASYTGIIYSSVEFPLARLAASQSSGATTYHSVSLANVAAGGAPSAGINGCTDQSSGPTSFVICSYSADASFPYGHTMVAYVRSTSSVAYASQQYYVAYTGGVPSACDPASTDTGANCYYVLQPVGAALVPYGSSYTFSVILETATRHYASLVTIPLSSVSLPVATLFTCSDVTTIGGDSVPVLYHACQGTTGTDIRKAGDMPSLVGITQVLP